jgi:hypothetical protein
MTSQPSNDARRAAGGASGDAAERPPPAVAAVPGSTSLTRLARQVTGGPGGRAFGVGQWVRRLWWAVLSAADRLGRLLRPAPGSPSVATAVRRCRDGRVRAVVDATATPGAVHRASVAAVSAALSAHSVDYVAVPDRWGRVRLALSDADAGRAHDALLSVPADAPLHLGLIRRGQVTGLRGAARVPTRRMRSARAVRAVLPATDPDGRGVIGADDGVDVEFWGRRPDGTWVAPRPNRFAATLDPSVLRPATLELDELALPSYAELLARHPDDVTFPVDAVFTWVDGDDPAWRERMTAAREEVTGVHAAHATAEARFRGLDELRYSLRALAANAPWVNHVWLVTDGQVPSWLRTDHPRLTVVDHRDIWVDPALLPVFNSHAIESQLHRIDGLAEHFVYFNDDVFLGRPVEPSLFFEPGGAARFYPSSSQVGVGPWQPSDPAPAAAAKNGRALLLDSVGVSPTQKLTHVPHAQRRSVGYELAERFPDDYRRVAGSRFRSVEDISPVWLGLWYAQATGRAITATMAYRYIDVVRPGAFRAMRVLRSRRDLEVFCLNQSQDSTVDADRLRRALGDFLCAYYPFRSSFEAD